MSKNILSLHQIPSLKVFHPTIDNIEISSSQNQKVNMNKFMKSSRGVAEPIRDTGSYGSYSSKTQEE